MSPQELLYFKTENLKLKENFDKFLKLHEANKKYISKNKVRDFMEAQKILIDNLNQQIDKIIAKDQEDDDQQFACTLPQKRTRNEILPQETTSKGPIIYFMEGRSPSRHKWRFSI